MSDDSIFSDKAWLAEARKESQAIPDTGGVWTMTDAEFKRELAKAWDEGKEAGHLDYYNTSNPYRSQL